MTHPEIHTLNDLIDDELDAAARAAVERHLAGCAECRAEVAALRDVLNGAVTLPESIEPSRDLWPAIAAEYEATRAATPLSVSAGGERTLQTLWRLRAPLAAAATVVLLLGSGGTYLLMRGAEPAAPAVATTTSPAVDPAVRTVAAFPGEPDYERAIGELRAALAARSNDLDPQTVATVERNLRIVDTAIGEAQAALAADPGNGALTRTLSDTYRTKIQLLRRAVELPART